MKKQLLVVLLFFCLIVTSQKKDSIYFDKNWKETSKINAAFYRPLPMNTIGNYQLVRDYYSNGNLQMQGYSIKNNVQKLVGDINYYDQFFQESISYDNNTDGLSGTFSYYYFDRKLWKTTTYKNGKFNGKTTYYFKNGTIMLDGFYENGNCISGSVSYDTKFNSDFRLKKGEQEKQITKIIYWENSKQIAQKQNILLKKFGRQLIGQQNFDKSGKLLQQLEKEQLSTSNFYDEGISNGIEYEYYIKQNFAISLKSEIQYLNGEKNGASINYDVSGKIKNKMIYKNDLPSDGMSEQKLSYNLLLTSNWKNSLKEGEEMAKSDKDSIIAKGIYKDGKPFNGRFISEKDNGNNSEFYLNNFNNFITDGLQQILNSENKVVESYFLKNGKKEGIVTTITDGIKSEIEYKNNLPWQGIVRTKNSEIIYKNSFLISETTFYNYNSKRILEKKEYENGQIIKVISSRFSIAGNLEKDEKEFLEFDKNNSDEEQFLGFVGFYKDEKPLSGFFENIKDEFKIVDFFENGVLKYQYSKDWFSTLGESENQNTELKLKSTFKNGKIVDGNEYINYGKIIAIKKYEKEILKTLDINFFEINYYNKLHYEIKNNTIEISELQNKEIKLLVGLQDNSIHEELFVKNKIIAIPRSKVMVLNEPFLPNSIVFYFEAENEILTRNETTIDDKSDIFEFYGNSIILKDYTFIPKNTNAKNVADLFAEIGSQFVQEQDFEEKTANKLDNEDQRENFKVISDLIIDKNAKPKRGIMITKNIDQTYLLRLYEAGKIIKSKDKVAFKNCFSVAKNIKK